MVPYLVEICCGIVEEKGLRTKGIYRVPGNSSVTKQLQEEINLRGVDCLLDPEDPKFNTELNCVSSLLKHYFRTLLDPLFTNGRLFLIYLLKRLTFNSANESTSFPRFFKCKI